MLRFALRALLLFLSFIVIMILHVSLLFFLPEPFNKINTIIIALVMMLLTTDSGSVIWFAAFLYFCLELYTVTPFGIVLAAGTISLLVLVWLYRAFFTNRSVVSAAALAGVGLLLYRAFYSIGLLFISSSWQWRSLLTVYGWEVLVTVPTAAVVYFLWSRILKRLHHYA